MIRRRRHKMEDEEEDTNMLFYHRHHPFPSPNHQIDFVNNEYKIDQFAHSREQNDCDGYKTNKQEERKQKQEDEDEDDAVNEEFLRGLESL